MELLLDVGGHLLHLHLLSSSPSLLVLVKGNQPARCSGADGEALLLLSLSLLQSYDHSAEVLILNDRRGKSIERCQRNGDSGIQHRSRGNSFLGGVGNASITLFDEVLPLVFDEIPLPAADLFPPISLDILPLVLGMACGIAGWVLETGRGPTLT